MNTLTAHSSDRYGIHESTLLAQRSEIFNTLDNQTVWLFEAIAAKIEKEPELLLIPLENIARWLAYKHPCADRLNAWKRKIELAQSSPSEFALLMKFLRDTSPEAQQWKGFSPFPGVLSSAELDAKQ